MERVEAAEWECVEDVGELLAWHLVGVRVERAASSANGEIFAAAKRGPSTRELRNLDSA